MWIKEVGKGQLVLLMLQIYSRRLLVCEDAYRLGSGQYSALELCWVLVWGPSPVFDAAVLRPSPTLPIPGWGGVGREKNAAVSRVADSRLLWLLLTPGAPYLPLATVHHAKMRNRRPRCRQQHPAPWPTAACHDVAHPPLPCSPLPTLHHCWMRRRRRCCCQPPLANSRLPLFCPTPLHPVHPSPHFTTEG